MRDSILRSKFRLLLCRWGRDRRVDGHGRQDRVDLAVEVVVEEGILGGSELTGGADPDAMLAEIRVDLLEPGLVKSGDEVMGATGDLQQLSQGAHAVGWHVLRLEVLVKLSLQASHAHLEEFVEVGCADRQEFEPVEQRVGGVACLLEDSLVKVEPAQLTIEEQGHIEGRAGWGHRCGYGRGTIELRASRGHEKNPHRRLPNVATAGCGRGSTGMQSIEPQREMIGGADPKTSYYHKLLENSQVAGVKILAVLDSLGSFQNHRQMAEPEIIDQVPEGFQSHFPGADPGVSVHAAAALAAAIVQVPDPQTVDSYRFVQLLDGFIVPFGPIQRIARRENVAGIHAHSQPPGVSHTFQNGLQVVESIAKPGALPRGRFQVDRHAQILGSTVKFVDRKRDPPQTGLLACSHVSAGMDDQIPDTELVAPLISTTMASIDLFQSASSGLARLIKYELCATVSRIPVRSRLTERAGLLEGQGRGVPLIIVFGKYLHDLEAHVVRATTARS